MNKIFTSLSLISIISLLSACGPTSGVSGVSISGVIDTGGVGASSTTANQKSVSGIGYSAAAVTDLSNYTLVCVTFTNPPSSAIGNLNNNGDGTYSYDLNLADAAGKPIGCFINNASNVPVTTVAFNITDGTGLNNSTTGAPLSGGSHTININFDPETNAASANITSANLDESNNDTGSNATALATTMAGNWSLTCADNTDTDCSSFLEAGPGGYLPIYVNIASGNQDGQQVHAMGVWQSETLFTSCGGHEGMSATALGYHGVTGTNQTASSNSGSPAGNFTGQHSDLAGAGAYTLAQSGSGDVIVSGNLGTIRTTLTDTVGTDIAYDPTFNDAWVGGGTDWCDNANTTLTDFNVDSDPGRTDRSCYAESLGWGLHDLFRDDPVGNASLACAPSLDTGKVHEIIWAHNGSSFTNTDANINIPYQTHLGGVSPQIPARYALMGLEFIGGSAIATDHRVDEWSEFDGSTTKNCKNVNDLSINMVPAADGQSAVGQFTMKEWRGCDGVATSNSFQTFDVNFSKQ